MTKQHPNLLLTLLGPPADEDLSRTHTKQFKGKLWQTIPFRPLLRPISSEDVQHNLLIFGLHKNEQRFSDKCDRELLTAMIRFFIIYYKPFVFIEASLKTLLPVLRLARLAFRLPQCVFHIMLSAS